MPALVLVVVIMAVVQLVLGILCLLLLLGAIAVLDGTIIVDCALLVIAVLDRVLQLDVLGVLSEQEQVLCENVDDHEDVENLQSDRE